MKIELNPFAADTRELFTSDQILHEIIIGGYAKRYQLPSLTPGDVTMLKNLARGIKQISAQYAHDGPLLNRFLKVSTQLGESRDKALNDMYREAAFMYRTVINLITPKQAALPSSDGRSISQVVGHIMAWEQWTKQAFDEIEHGVRLPSIMSLRYKDSKGGVTQYRDVDQFNAYVAESQNGTPWEQIRAGAIKTSIALESAFENPKIPFYLVEQTSPFNWTVGDVQFPDLPCGRYLKMVSIHHAGVEHAYTLFPFAFDSDVTQFSI